MGKRYTQEDLDILKRHYDDFFDYVSTAKLAHYIKRQYRSRFRHRSVSGIVSIMYRFWYADGNKPWKYTATNRKLRGSVQVRQSYLKRAS